MQVDNLISLKDDMVAFIAGHGMRRFNGYVTEEVPTVVFEDEDPDSWKDFVEHAKAAGATFVTMSEVTLEKSDIAILLDQLRDQNFHVSLASRHPVRPSPQVWPCHCAPHRAFCDNTH